MKARKIAAVAAALVSLTGTAHAYDCPAFYRQFNAFEAAIPMNTANMQAMTEIVSGAMANGNKQATIAALIEAGPIIDGIKIDSRRMLAAMDEASANKCVQVSQRAVFALYRTLIDAYLSANEEARTKLDAALTALRQ